MTTAAPRSCAATEAANPAAPNPTTTTSASTSQVCGTVLIVSVPMLPGGPLSTTARAQPHLAWPPASVIVMCPIVVSALAPCQWRSPALMCATSPSLISRCSCSLATMLEPDTTTSSCSQSCVCQPVVQPWLKLTTLQL